MGFDTPPDTPPDISKLGGCHPKTGGVLTPPRGGLHKSLGTTYYIYFIFKVLTQSHHAARVPRTVEELITSVTRNK